ncbi:MAG: phytase [Proteobacteria bacterium]|nr:phytase [Pseudomonadota bacterium]
MNYKYLPIFLSLNLAACQAPESPHSGTEAEADKVLTIASSGATTPTIADGANDPAIWVDTGNPSNSLILGAGGAGGLEFYNLDGTRLGTIGDSTINLVDVRNGFPVGGEPVALVVAYDVDASEIIGYRVNAGQRTLEAIEGLGLATGAELEGLCLYRSPLSGKFYAFAVAEGIIQQWELYEGATGVTGRRVRALPVGLGAGHCAVHDRESVVYFANETVGVLAIDAEPETEGEMRLVDLAQPFGRYAGDVKGIAVHATDDGGHLLVSDADESRLQVYELGSLTHVGTITIDGVEESEGIAATAAPLSGPGGLLVVTDDDNGDAATNYKMVSWQAVADALQLSPVAAGTAEAAMQPTAVLVSASVETEPVENYGDAADDPAIWVHPTDPAQSVIIGAQKKRGVNVYDLSGKLLQSRADGRINNIDLRYGFLLGGKSVAVVVGSNRSTDSISTYIVDAETRTLVEVADGLIDTGMSDPYGLCMYKSQKSGLYYVFVNGTDGLVRQWLLKDSGNNKIGMAVVREFKLDSQTEGCVADDETGDLYVGEEGVAIWKYSAEPDGGETRTMVDATGDAGNLTADVEGLAIYYGANGAGYLIASNQGADNYAMYERSGGNKFLGIFHVVADDATGIDGVSETDGLDVNAANLGLDFPAGVFVAQDGRNISPAERQNFKLVPWQRISDAMGLDQD